MLKDSTAGDPMGGLRWTHKTTRKLATELRQRGVSISHTTVVRLLKEQDYSLRTNRKRLAGTRDPERDRQFRLLARRRNRFQNQGWPVISVDTKKLSGSEMPNRLAFRMLMCIAGAGRKLDTF